MSVLMIKQPIAGVSPPELTETTIMTVWPTLGATGLGRFMGRLFAIKLGFGNIFTVGKLLALLSIPLALGLFFAMLMPGLIRRYRLTNRRVMIESGLQPVVDSWVDLDRFDTINVVVLPGQEWYPAGDLVFTLGPIETFRLAGVSRPETFRRTCMAAHLGYIGVRGH